MNAKIPVDGGIKIKEIRRQICPCRIQYGLNVIYGSIRELTAFSSQSAALAMVIYFIRFVIPKFGCFQQN